MKNQVYTSAVANLIEKHLAARSKSIGAKKTKIGQKRNILKLKRILLWSI